MQQESMLSAAVRGIFLGAAIVSTGPAVAQESGEPIEEIVTTGTRIVRADMFDTAGHVVNIEEEQIDALSVLNVADVLRSSPLNIYGSFSERSGNTALSNATIDLRGLGSERTLVLIDGMRLPGSPNLGADSVNINMLPMTAIQRIDILADGASAVYGSDAVAGVLNLVMHKNFDGAEISMRYGDRSEDDGSDVSAGFLAGGGSGRGNVTLALEYSRRDPIFDRDRSYTAPWVRDTDGDGEIHLYADTDGISYLGRTWEIYDPNTNYYELAAAADCPTTDGFVGVMGAGSFGLPDQTMCGYAYAEISANRAELEKVNSYVHASYDLTADVELYARGLFSENEAFGRFAPPAALWPNPPASHPHNPFDMSQMIVEGLITDEAELWGYYRWTNVGPRDDHVKDTQWDGVVGVKGKLTDNVSFDVYAQSGEYTSRTKGKYYLSYTGLEEVLNNDIDPFSDEGVALMRAMPWQDNFTKQNRLYAHVQFGAGDWIGAAEAIGLIGAEYTDIDYANQFDPESEAGLIGGSAGNSSAGRRHYKSVFFEYLLPVTYNSELNIAGRYDDYSDFGSEFSPSISYSISVNDYLALRARWGQGFKAPALNSLYGAEAFFAEGGYDPITGANRGFPTYYSPNPDLDAELSTSYSIGMNWEYVEGHSIDLAYYAVEIEDVITWPSAQSIMWAEAAGVELGPDGTRVERVGGNVREVHSFASNADKLEVSGIDVQLHSVFEASWGHLAIDAFVSHQLEYKQNAFFKGGFQDTAGFAYQPQSRAQASVRWDLGNHGIDWVVDYIGPYAEGNDIDLETGRLTTSKKDLDSWTVMNLAYRFDAQQYGALKIGANNLMNKDPVLDKDGKYDNSYLYDAIGRVIYVEYGKAFR